MNLYTLNVVKNLQKTYVLEIDEESSSKDKIIIRSVMNTEEEVNQIIESIQKDTNTNFILKPREKNPKRFIFHKSWICHHTSFRKKKAASKRNINCKSFIDVTIKKISRNTVYKDKFLKRKIPFVCLIKTNLEHSHQTGTPDTLKFLRIAPETEAQFEEYFSDGLSPSEARHLHEKRMLTEGRCDVMDNPSYNPTTNQLYYLYDKWKKKNDGSSSDPPEKCNESTSKNEGAIMKYHKDEI